MAGLITKDLIIDDAWDIPTDSTPSRILELVELLLDSDDTAHIAVDLASGLYWHCADYHGGQTSERYSILSCLDYNPGACERGPSSDGSQYVYDVLAENSA